MTPYIAKELAILIAGAIETATAPLRDRIGNLERRIAELDSPRDGRTGKDRR